jgi:hypothetical protein
VAAPRRHMPTCRAVVAWVMPVAAAAWAAWALAEALARCACPQPSSISAKITHTSTSTRLGLLARWQRDGWWWVNGAPASCCTAHAALFLLATGSSCMVSFRQLALLHVNVAACGICSVEGMPVGAISNRVLHLDMLLHVSCPDVRSTFWTCWLTCGNMMCRTMCDLPSTGTFAAATGLLCAARWVHGTLDVCCGVY